MNNAYVYSYNDGDDDGNDDDFKQKNASYFSDSDTIDTRKFRTETYTMLNRGSSLDKTLSQFFRSKSNNIHTSSADAHVSSHHTGIHTASLASAELSASMIGKSIINPLSKQTKFLSLCWEVFKKYDASTGSSANSNSGMYIAVENIALAIEDLSHSVDRELVLRLVQQLYPSSSKAMLSWKEFKNVCGYIIQVHKKKKFVNKNGVSQQHKHSQHYNESSVDSHENTAYIQSPYQQLEQKQRCASMSTNNIRSDEAPSSLLPAQEACSVANMLPHSITSGAADSKVNEALIDRFKQEGRVLRKLQQVNKVPSSSSSSSSSSLSIHHDNVLQSSIDSLSQIHLDNPSVINSVIASNSLDTSSFAQQLQKTRVYELSNKNNSYPMKWKQMLQKRKLRESSIVKKQLNRNLIASFNKIVFAEERDQMSRSLYNEEYVTRSNMQNNFIKEKEKEAHRIERIHAYKHEHYMKVSQSAASLKDAVQHSTELAKSLYMDELKAKKQALLGSSSSTKISEHTSCLVPIPHEIQSRIKNARRLQDYNQAKEDAKMHFNNVMADRFKTGVATKNKALVRVKKSGSPISLAPIHPDDYFDANNTHENNHRSYGNDKKLIQDYMQDYSRHQQDNNDEADELSMQSWLF